MPRVAWTKAAIRKLVETLEGQHGVGDERTRLDPMDELISCILSQHTSDATSFPTFFRLRERYRSWDQIARLSEQQLAEEIHTVGLVNQKARAIRAVLRELRKQFGAYTLEPLRQMDIQEARRFLLSLPGVGPKTAAIVLCFGFGLPAIPVDTHVFRVSWRLGLIEKRVGADRAHLLLEEMVPSDLAYRFHVALIRHGRRTCHARSPRCGECAVRRRCAWYRETRGQ
ncbi:MAG: DNA lyase [Armatimonadota bacterium]